MQGSYQGCHFQAVISGIHPEQDLSDRINVANRLDRLLDKRNSSLLAMLVSRSEFCSDHEPFLPAVHIIGGISHKVVIGPGDVPFVALALIERRDIHVHREIAIPAGQLFLPDHVTVAENGRIMKLAEGLFCLHALIQTLACPLGRGNAVGHVQRLRIEVRIAPNIIDAFEGGIAAAHARDLCLDAIRELVNIGRVRQFRRKRIEAFKPCLSENLAGNGYSSVGNDMLPGGGHGEDRIRET